MSSFRKYIRTIENRKLPSVVEGHPIFVKYKKQRCYGIVSKITKNKLFFRLMGKFEVPYSPTGNAWETDYNFKTGFCNSETYEVFDKATGMKFMEYLKNV